MPVHEIMKPGVYEDEKTGDIWRKLPSGKWTVNGMGWQPFPKALTHLQKVVDVPAVSIADAVQPDLSMHEPIKARYSDIIMPSRHAASLVLDALTNMIERYASATVSDLYDLVGLASTYKDQKLGWRNISGATIERARNGYLLDLPAPQPI